MEKQRDRGDNENILYSKRVVLKGIKEKENRLSIRLRYRKKDKFPLITSKRKVPKMTYTYFFLFTVNKSEKAKDQ